MTLLAMLAPEASKAPTWLMGLWQDLDVYARAFVFLLTHDNIPRESKNVVIPYLLAGWLVASVATCPLVKPMLKALGSKADLRRVVAINFGIILTQLSFFAVNWFMIGWGNRSADWGVFGASLVPATLISHLGFELSLSRALIHALIQPLIALLLVFLVVFVLVQTGHLKL